MLHLRTKQFHFIKKNLNIDFYFDVDGKDDAGEGNDDSRIDAIC